MRMRGFFASSLRGSIVGHDRHQISAIRIDKLLPRPDLSAGKRIGYFKLPILICSQDDDRMPHADPSSPGPSPGNETVMTAGSGQ